MLPPKNCYLPPFFLILKKKMAPNGPRLCKISYLVKMTFVSLSLVLKMCYFLDEFFLLLPHFSISYQWKSYFMLIHIFYFIFLVFWTQIFCCFDLFEVVLVPNGHFCQFLQYFGENIRNFNDQMYQMGLKYEFFCPPKIVLVLCWSVCGRLLKKSIFVWGFPRGNIGPKDWCV